MLSSSLGSLHASGDALADQRRFQLGHGIRRFGRFTLNMADLPDPLNPQPLPFEAAL